MPDIPNPYSVLRMSRKYVSEMRYAIAAAGILAVVFIAIAWIGDHEYMLFGPPAVFALMIGIMCFQNLFTKDRDSLTRSSLIFAWSYLIIFVLYIVLIATSTLFGRPLDLRKVYGVYTVSSPNSASESFSLYLNPGDSTSTFTANNWGWEVHETRSDNTSRVAKEYRITFTFSDWVNFESSPQVFVEILKLDANSVEKKIIRVYAADISQHGFTLVLEEEMKNSYFSAEETHLVIRWTAISLEEKVHGFD